MTAIVHTTRRRWILLAVLLVAVGALAWVLIIARDTTQPLEAPPRATSNTEEGEELKFLEVTSLPESPPSLLIDGESLDPLYVSWFEPGEPPRTVVPPEDATASQYYTVTVNNQLTFSINSPVQPAVVNARYYYQLEPNGLPSDVEDSHVECNPSASNCTIDASTDRVSATIDFDPSAVFAVIEVFYHNISDDAAMPFSIVTFGFNTRT